MIVVDTNLIAYLFLTSERSTQAELAFQKDAQWAAPLLWRSEFCNVLVAYIRKKYLSEEDAFRIMEEAIRLMRGQEYEGSSHQVLNLAVSSTCSAYDCEFVVLAKDLGVLLLTVDKQILDQHPDVAIALDDYIGA